MGHFFHTWTPYLSGFYGVTERSGISGLPQILRDGHHTAREEKQQPSTREAVRQPSVREGAHQTVEIKAGVEGVVELKRAK